MNNDKAEMIKDRLVKNFNYYLLKCKIALSFNLDYQEQCHKAKKCIELIEELERYYNLKNCENLLYDLNCRLYEVY